MNYLRKLTINQKLILLSLIGIIFILIYGTFVLREMKKLNHHADKVTQYEMNKIEKIDKILYNMLSTKYDEINMMFETKIHNRKTAQQFSQDINKKSIENKDLLSEYANSKLFPEEEKIYNNLVIEIEECNKTHEQLFVFLEEEKLSEAKPLWIEMQKHKDEILRQLNNLRLMNLEQLRDIRTDINEQASKEIKKLVIVLAIGVILMIIISFSVYRSISNRLKQIITYTLNISEDKNTDKNKAQYTEDELDIILKSLDKMKKQIEKLRLDIKYKDFNIDHINRELKEKINFINQELEKTKVMIDKSIDEKKKDIKNTIDDFKNKNE